jgi:hypothetical protein
MYPIHDHTNTPIHGLKKQNGREPKITVETKMSLIGIVKRDDSPLRRGGRRGKSLHQELSELCDLCASVVKSS